MDTISANPPRSRGLITRRRSWSGRLAISLIAAAIIAGVATYGALTRTPPVGHKPYAVLWLLDIDFIIVALFAMLIGQRAVMLWISRRQGKAGSRLHARLALIFSFLATAPAIIMTIFATLFLHIGVQSWFSDRVRTAVTESKAVAEAYLQEHIQVIRADSLAMAHDLDRQAPTFLSDPEAFNKIMQTQSMIRDLPEVAVLTKSGNVLAHVGQTVMLEIATIPTDDMAHADLGEVVVMAKAHDDRVRALVKLNNFPDAYLFVARAVDPTVLANVTDTTAAVEEYERLEAQRSGLQVRITMIFISIALLLLALAIWFSLIFSRQLMTPISALITAADRIRAGDMTVRVPARGRHDEFDVLARAFNRMTGEIQEQRDKLVAANRQLDERRRFIEAVLAGVSAGIVGVEPDGRISLANASALELFGVGDEPLTGYNIDDVLPAVRPILQQARSRPNRITQAEIPFTARAQDGHKTLLVRVAVERIGRHEVGAVLTFDDITELQSAQRKAAWSDVARRIAHEIKNPLTPIQLSAERLKRKYLKQITEDAETFAQCTDTIIEHVGDIGRMVNEFSSFARMPEPVVKPADLSRLVADVVGFQRQAHPDITFIYEAPAQAIASAFDARQIRQAFSNILQNAIESILVRWPEGGGKVGIRLTPDADGISALIIVADNGLGLPKNEDAARLTEPYVTHKEKGTGLGLAIVKKIMEDHGGRVILGMPDWLRQYLGEADAFDGAIVSLSLPVLTSEMPVDENVEQRRAVS